MHDGSPSTPATRNKARGRVRFASIDWREETMYRTAVHPRSMDGCHWFCTPSWLGSGGPRRQGGEAGGAAESAPCALPPPSSHLPLCLLSPLPVWALALTGGGGGGGWVQVAGSTRAGRAAGRRDRRYWLPSPRWRLPGSGTLGVQLTVGRLDWRLGVFLSAARGWYKTQPCIQLG